MNNTNNIYRKKMLAYIGLCLVTLIVGLSFIFVKIGLRSANTYDLLVRFGQEYAAHRFSFAFLLVLISKMFRFVKIAKRILRVILDFDNQNVTLTLLFIVKSLKMSTSISKSQ